MLWPIFKIDLLVNSGLRILQTCSNLSCGTAGVCGSLNKSKLLPEPPAACANGT